MGLTIYTHASGLDHQTPDGHIERRERQQTLLDLFASDFSDVPVKTAPQATLDQVLAAHDESYVFALEEKQPMSGIIPLDGGDTYMSPDSYTTALHASGAAVMAVDDVLSGESKTAFCAMRPPGHHAEPNAPMGFCLFNQIFIGALHALEDANINKVAIVDFDVHHGNGSETMALKHDGVFYISSHQWPLFPGTGGPDTSTEGRVLNIPLAEGTGSKTFRAVYEEQVFPALEAYAPDLLMISAGFDACADDPSASLNLQPDDFGWVTEQLIQKTALTTGGKTVSVLEGGYNLDNLKLCAAAHLNALIAA
ncbi:MAG: histone deacetylase family protein [Pseudomonadota bacterium]